MTINIVFYITYRKFLIKIILLNKKILVYNINNIRGI